MTSLRGYTCQVYSILISGVNTDPSFSCKIYVSQKIAKLFTCMIFLIFFFFHGVIFFFICPWIETWNDAFINLSNFV
jgi:hypothetical protein